MDYKKDKKIIKNKGFVSLLALILANVFLMIGLSVFAISIKELGLSFGSRESLFAFYAADGGMECALYWDIQQDAFATSSLVRLNEITCAEHSNIDVSYSDLGGGSGESSFNFSFGSDIGDPCAEVKVTKDLNAFGEITTEIISRGRNSCDTDNSRRVERAWRVTY